MGGSYRIANQKQMTESARSLGTTAVTAQKSKAQSAHNQSEDQPMSQEVVTEVTEVYCWGNDRDGQLGLGHNSEQLAYAKPKCCSFNISIGKMACGQDHSVFITSNGLVYSMGSNGLGQLGINDPSIK